MKKKIENRFLASLLMTAKPLRVVNNFTCLKKSILLNLLIFIFANYIVIGQVREEVENRYLVRANGGGGFFSVCYSHYFFSVYDCSTVNFGAQFFYYYFPSTQPPVFFLLHLPAEQPFTNYEMIYYEKNMRTFRMSVFPLSSCTVLIDEPCEIVSIGFRNENGVISETGCASKDKLFIQTGTCSSCFLHTNSSIELQVMGKDNQWHILPYNYEQLRNGFEYRDFEQFIESGQLLKFKVLKQQSDGVYSYTINETRIRFYKDIELPADVEVEAPICSYDVPIIKIPYFNDDIVSRYIFTIDGGNYQIGSSNSEKMIYTTNPNYIMINDSRFSSDGTYSVTVENESKSPCALKTSFTVNMPSTFVLYEYWVDFPDQVGDYQIREIGGEGIIILYVIDSRTSTGLKVLNNGVALNGSFDLFYHSEISEYHDGYLRVVLPAGEHKLRLFDGYCLSNEITVVMREPEKKISFVPVVTNPDCNPSSTDNVQKKQGKVEITEIKYGLEIGYTVSIFCSDDQLVGYAKLSHINEIPAFELPPGTYTVRVCDGYNGTSSEIRIIEPAAFTVDYEVTKELSIWCSEDAEILVTAEGGTGEIMYCKDGSNFDYSQTLVGFSSGEHIIYIQDKNDCTVKKLITIEPPELPVIVSEEEPIAVKCHDGEGLFILNVSNVKGTLLFDGIGVQPQITDDNTKYTFYELKAGDYSSNIFEEYRVNDRIFRCSMPDITFKIDNKPPITVNPIEDVIYLSDKGSTVNVELTIEGGNGDNGGYTVTLNEPPFTELTAPPYVFYSLVGAPNDGRLYLFDAVDSEECTGSGSVLILEPELKLSLSATISKPVSCYGVRDAIVALTANGGWGNYQFRIDGGDWKNEPTFDELGVGYYSFHVRDLHGGVASTLDLYVPEPNPLTVEIVDFQHISCKGGNDGWIRYKISGGTPQYEFNLENGEINDDLLTVKKLLATTYDSFTIKDGRGCTITAPSITLSQPVEELNVNIQNIENTTCELNNGAVTAYISGGTASYQIQLMNIENDLIIDFSDMNYNGNVFYSDLSAGDYRIYVTDANECFTAHPFDIAPYLNPTVNNVTNEPVVCFGESNGKITVTANESTSIVDYFKLKSQFSDMEKLSYNGEFADMPYGSYQIDIFDVLGCKTNTSHIVHITQPDNLILQENAVRDVANKGEATGFIEFRTSGGNDHLRHLFLTTADGVEIAQFTASVSALHNFSNLPANRYIIQVSDSKGCTAASNIIEVLEPDFALGFRVIEKKDALCKSEIGNVTVEGFGGWGDYKYRRGGDANGGFFVQSAFEQLYPGSYIITVTDKLGGLFSDTIIIHEPKDKLMATIIDIQEPSCNDNGILTIKIEGGTAPYTLWEGAKNLHFELPEIVHLNGRQAGEAIFRLIDDNGCIFELDTYIPNSNLLKITAFDIIYPTQQGANDGKIHAITQGGMEPLTWQWTDRSDNLLADNNEYLENIPAGMYRTKVIDAGGCLVSESVFLPDIADAYFEIIDIGHETHYQAANGFAVLFSQNNDITEYELISPMGEIQIYSSLFSDNNFRTDNGTVYLNNLYGGRWFLLGKDVSGAKSIAEFFINPYEQFVFISYKTVDVSRRGYSDGGITVEIAGGGGDNRFDWTNNNSNIVVSTDGERVSVVNNVPAGTYTVSVTDRYGNVVSESFTVREPEMPLKISIAEHRNQSCKDYLDSRLVIAAEGGWGNYQFRHDAETYPSVRTEYFGLEVRVHTFYLTDRAGVTESIEVVVTEPDYLRAAILQVDSVLCKNAADGKIHFAVSGGTEPYRLSHYPNINWQDGVSISGLPEGWYTIVFTDANGCTGQDIIEVYMPEPDLLQHADINVTHTTCGEDNGAIAIEMQGGTKPYKYRWTDAQDNVLGEYSKIDNLQQSAQYRLLATDKNNCMHQLQQFISASSAPVINNIVTTPVVCHGESTGVAAVTAITAGEPFATWRITWSNGIQTDEGETGNPVNYAYGTHHVTITDANDCYSVRYFDIAQPERLQIALVNYKEPHCFGWNDAFIHTAGLGGTQPYRFLWSNAKTEPRIENLTKGEYSLTLIDANECNTVETYALNEPEELFVELGKDFVICPGSSMTIDGRAFPTHRWFTIADGDIFNERYLTVRDAGDYFLEATDNRGCAVHGKISVEVGSSALIADFMLPSTIAIGDTMIMIEISNLPTDSLRWEYDNRKFTNISEMSSQSYIFLLIANETGMYNIDMTAWAGNCTSHTSRLVNVVPASEKQQETVLGFKEPLISSIIVYPNPTSGYFNVEIELREKRAIQLTLFEVVTGMRVNDRQEGGMDIYNINYSLNNLNSGVYVLLLTAGDERKQVRIVIER